MKVEMKDPTFFESRKNLMMFALQAEPEICQKSLTRAMHIMDLGRNTPQKVNETIDNCAHLKEDEKQALKQLLNNYKELFDSTLGGCKTEPISIEMNEGEKLSHDKPYLVPLTHKE